MTVINLGLSMLKGRLMAVAFLLFFMAANIGNLENIKSLRFILISTLEVL